mmetsp:Transcript_101048/g.185086  ORF Transcript_101048/g.185086 Transcript_101048/m.185086 type:complete len:195 (+) Transcript_101048:1-585(+)
MSLAKRLGERVLKVYINCWSMGTLSDRVAASKYLQASNAQTDDVGVFKFLCKSMPNSAMLKTMREGTKEEDLAAEIAKSSAIQDLIELARRQYTNAIFPHPERDLGQISAPILALHARQDYSLKPESFEAWKTWTSGAFNFQVVEGGAWSVLSKQPQSPARKGSRVAARNSSKPAAVSELYACVCKDMVESAYV